MTVSEKTKEETGARCTKVQSSRRELWANVSLSHPAFGSLLRQSLFLRQSSHFTCFFFCFLFLASQVSERDKKLDDLRAHSGSEPRARVNSSSSPHPSPSSLSPLLSLHPTSPRAKLRGGSGWVDEQETLVTHYDKRRIILYDSRGIFSRGCVMCPSHSSIHLAAMKDHLSNLCQCVPGGGYKNKNPGEIDENVARLLRSTHAHTYIM